MTAQPDQEIINAARKVLREALDAVDVHPCDEHNDLVRAASLYGPMEELYRAMLGQPDQEQITLRDQFAMAAMNQLLENPLYCPSLVDGRRLLADVSYKVADAMLVERRKK